MHMAQIIVHSAFRHHIDRFILRHCLAQMLLILVVDDLLNYVVHALRDHHEGSLCILELLAVVSKKSVDVLKELQLVVLVLRLETEGVVGDLSKELIELHKIELFREGWSLQVVYSRLLRKAVHAHNDAVCDESEAANLFDKVECIVRRHATLPGDVVLGVDTLEGALIPLHILVHLERIKVFHFELGGVGNADN